MTNHITPTEWNGWVLDPNIPALIYNTEHFQCYQIDLDRILTNDDVVFWTVQIGSKGWPGGLDGFVAAITDLYDPHRRMNTLWHIKKEDGDRPERSYTPESIRAAVAEFIADIEQRRAEEAAYTRAEAAFQ